MHYTVIPMGTSKVNSSRVFLQSSLRTKCWSSCNINKTRFNKKQAKRISVVFSISLCTLLLLYDSFYWSNPWIRQYWQCYIFQTRIVIIALSLALISSLNLLSKIKCQCGCQTLSEVLFLKEIFWTFVNWGYSSVAEHSTADREVAGSTPAAPFFIQSLFLPKSLL